MKNILHHALPDIHGNLTPLSNYKGNILLLVNVASKCGLTPQYADLQQLYEKYRDQGLTVLGFPANNFGGQEPGTNEEIATFCTTNYGVSFPMFSKISVAGEDQHPLYKDLVEATNKSVSWNFQKYLVDRSGNVVKSFEPIVKVNDPEFLTALEQLL